MARLEVEIIGDSRSLERAFARSEKSAKGFDKSISKTGKTGQRAFGGLSKAAGLFGVGLGAAAVVDGLKSTVDAASNLNEEIGKTGVVFGDSSKALVKWSETTAGSIGISERAALAATGTFGNMLVPMGFVRKDAARMSQRMVQLAGDMASFNNASPEDTLLALRSGIAGESEPLRKFGVFLSEARIKQEALSAGLIKGKEKLTAAQKAQAIYNIILKDTKDAQGDAARTGQNWAGVQRRLGATLENLSAQIGQMLLPTLEKLGNQLVKWLSNTKNQQTIMTTLKSTVAAVTGVVKTLTAAFQVFSKIVGGSKNAMYLLIGAFVAFKALKMAATVMTIARSVGILGATSATTAGKVGLLNRSLLGKAGLIGAAGLASYELTRMALKVTGLNKKLAGLGASAFDAAAKIGLVHDPGEQFKGKTVLGSAASGFIRQQAARLEARGMTPQQAATRIAAQHPNVARRDIGVLAGEYGGRPIVIHNTFELDGTVVTRTVNKHNARGAKRTGHQTSGFRG